MLRAKRMTPPSENSLRQRTHLRSDRRARQAADQQLADVAADGAGHGSIIELASSIILCVIIRTSAPTRIDLAGGTIDIWPLYLFHPGAQTLNAAISLRASARIEPRSDTRIAIKSLDTGATVEAEDWRELRDVRELRLLSLLVHFFEASGITLTTTSESPAGAGIAGSSALNVAVCAALAEWKRTHYEPEALLQIAMNVEAQAISVPTGLQDYRPALYGGIAAIELEADGVRRVPLDVDLGELQQRIVLCYTGEPRNSGTNNWEITKRHIDGDRFIFDCFERIRDTAATMRNGAHGWRLGQRRPGDRGGMGQPQAPCSRRDDACHRRPDRTRDGRWCDRRQGLRCRRRRLSVLLRPAECPRGDSERAGRRWRAHARLHLRAPRARAWIIARSRRYSARSPTCSKSRATTPSRSARTGPAAETLATWPRRCCAARRAAAPLDSRHRQGPRRARSANWPRPAPAPTTRNCSNSSRRRSSTCCAFRASVRRRWRCCYATLNIKSIDDLAAAAKAGKLKGLKGMGAKKEAQILAVDRGTRERQRTASAERHGRDCRVTGRLPPCPRP